jgi:hypothetical protein
MGFLHRLTMVMLSESLVLVPFPFSAGQNITPTIGIVVLLREPGRDTLILFKVPLIDCLALWLYCTWHISQYLLAASDLHPASKGHFREC